MVRFTPWRDDHGFETGRGRKKGRGRDHDHVGRLVMIPAKAPFFAAKAAVSKPIDRWSQGGNHNIMLGLELS